MGKDTLYVLTHLILTTIEVLSTIIITILQMKKLRYKITFTRSFRHILTQDIELQHLWLLLSVLPSKRKCHEDTSYPACLPLHPQHLANFLPRSGFSESVVNE